MGRIKLFCMLVIMIIGLIFCSNSVSSDNFTGVSELAQQLETAYQQNSQELLNEFFGDWKSNLPSYSNNKISTFSDTVEQVYKIFNEFYSPEELNRIKGGGHENFESNFRYIVAQNSLHYTIVDTNPKFYYYAGVSAIENIIGDFRPSGNALTKPVVFLSEEMESLIFDFFFHDLNEPKDDLDSRVTFLRQAIQLTHHHWIYDFHKATMPIVENIYINDSFNKALVTFRVFYQFGDAYLERKNNNWELIESRLTAIE